jgi:hypothetical protein
VGVAQRIVDQRQHAVQIPIDFIVPEPQYPEALDDKVIVPPRITPGMCIEVMLTAVDLDDEAMFETDEIYDISIARGLAAEVESLVSP